MSNSKLYTYYVPETIGDAPYDDWKDAYGAFLEAEKRYAELIDDLKEKLHTCKVSIHKVRGRRKIGDNIFSQPKEYRELWYENDKGVVIYKEKVEIS